MKILPLLAAAGLMAFGLISTVTPSAAASIASCQDDVTVNPSSTAGAGTYTQYINANSGAIQAALKDKGINASGVTDWGGCVKADVVGKNGQTTTQFFDAHTLQRLSVNGG
jgi:hypothetical protein